MLSRKSTVLWSDKGLINCHTMPHFDTLKMSYKVENIVRKG